MKINNNDKTLVNFFLELPIDRKEFDKLFTLILEFNELFNFDKNYNFNKLNLEILDDKDDIYKQVRINLKDKTICIELCEILENKYFISKNITYHNENNIEFTKILAKSEYSKTDAFRELALKKWKYNGKDVSMKCFTELEKINYIKDIPIYSKEKYETKQNHYKRCLSKNK